MQYKGMLGMTKLQPQSLGKAKKKGLPKKVRKWHER